MPAPEAITLATIYATRVVANAAALDAATWPEAATAVRLAPDELLVVTGSESDAASILSADEHAIVVAETGFVGAWLTADDLDHVAGHADWPLPAARPAVAQGFVAGVPCKLLLSGATSGDHVALLLTNAPYRRELEERLS